MAKKRKNSNYVTERTIKREAERQHAIKVRKRNKVISWTLIVLSILISMSVMVISIGAKNGWWEKTMVTTAHAEIEIEGYGTLHIALYGENAPIAVDRFTKLAKSGYYKGKTFHSFMNDVLEGGDPKATGTGSNGTYIPMELNNGIHHRKGTISMKQVDERGASTVFFITAKNQLELDDTCTAFGRITEGYDVFEAICKYMEEQDQSQGTVAKDKQPVIKSITIHASHD